MKVFIGLNFKDMCISKTGIREIVIKINVTSEIKTDKNITTIDYLINNSAPYIEMTKDVKELGMKEDETELFLNYLFSTKTVYIQKERLEIYIIGAPTNKEQYLREIFIMSGIKKEQLIFIYFLPHYFFYLLSL